MKPRLHLLVDRAVHFARWEIPHFRRYFTLVSEPKDDAILFAFGPDVFEKGASTPACGRIALLFPWDGYSAYHDLKRRKEILEAIKENYDLVFVNPGPLHEALKSSAKVTVCPFSIDTGLATCREYRTSLNSLLHVSADAPQKDWRRSEAIMALTRLPYEVFPPRNGRPTFKAQNPIDEGGSKRPWYRKVNRIGYWLRIYARRWAGRNWFKIAKFTNRLGIAPVLPPVGYARHKAVIRKYQSYDGFVHVAAETPPMVDGKYTAALLEAGATGAILFWHDTLRLGNDFETVFDLPLEPDEAARQILEIRRNLDVPRHSRLTREEILDRCDPANVMRIRYEKMRALL